MKIEICIAVVLCCSFSGIGGWSDTLYRADPIRSYITSVQETSRLYSRQVHGASQSEGTALMREYRRELQLRAEELVTEWQRDKEREAVANVNPEEYEKEIEKVRQSIGVRRAEYLRQFERLTELYADRYLQPQLAKRRQNRNRAAGVNGLLQQVNAEMQLYAGGKQESLSSLNQWQRAENELLDQRMEWERKIENRYADELTQIKAEYRQVDDQTRRGLEALQRQYEQGIQLWQQREQELDSAWRTEFEQLKLDVDGRNAEAGELYARLSGAYNNSQALICEAEAHIYAGEDLSYWNMVRNEELDASEEIKAAYLDLMRPGTQIPAVLLEQEQSGIKVQIEAAGKREDVLQSLADSMDLPVDERKVEQLEARYEQLSKKSSAARDRAEGSAELLQQSSDLKAHAELQQLTGQLEQAKSFLSLRRELYRQELAELNSQVREVLMTLLPEQLQEEALMWVEEMEKERKAQRLDSFLKECALALYHEDKDALDPGYSSNNQSYNKLQSKLHSSPQDYLEAPARKAYNSIANDERKLRLYRFYSMALREQSDQSASPLRRAAVEDLGGLLFKEVVKHAARKSSALKQERKDLLKQAKIYAGLAAACYATLNIPGGAAFTAVAAGYAVAAADVKAKRDDINALKRSVSEQSMDGSAERQQVKQKLADLSSDQAEIHRIKGRIAYLGQETHSDEYWSGQIENGKGEFSFTRFYEEDPFGAEPLYQFMADASATATSTATASSSALGLPTGTVSEYLQKLIDRASERSEALEELRHELNARLLSELAECVAMSSREVDYPRLAESELQLQSLYGQGQSAYNLSGGLEEEDLASMLSLVQLAGVTRVMGAGYRKSLLDRQLLEQKDLWEQQLCLTIASQHSQRDGQLEKLRTASLQWDRDFRRGYLEQQQTWEQRLNKLHGARSMWLQQTLRTKAEEVCAEGEEFLKLNPQSAVRNYSFISMEQLPSWEAPSSAQYSRIERDVLSLDVSGMDSLIPELEQTRSRYAEYRQSVHGLYAAAKQRAERAAQEAGLRGFSRSLQEHQEELERMLQQANGMVADSLHNSLRAAGYRKHGTSFQRNAIVDVTYFEHERELQSIEEYRSYQLPKLDWQQRLQALGGQEKNAAHLESGYRHLLEQIKAQRQLVFGGYGEGVDNLLQAVDEQIRQDFQQEALGFSNSEGYSSHNDVEGLFHWHVGYAPEMSESRPEQIRQKGYGQTGRIITAYYIDEARLGRGLGMMESSGWDRRLWDDDADNDGDADSWMQAATIRSLSDLGIKTVAGLSMGPVAAALVGLSDDAFFAAADTAAGYKTWDESAFAFTKQVVVQAAAAASAGVWDSLQAVPDWDEQAALFRNVLPAAGEAAGGQLIEAGAAGLNYSHSTGWDWDYERFSGSLYNPSAAVKVGLAAAGAFSAGVSHNQILQKNHTFGFSYDDIADMRSGIALGGDLLSSAVEYGLTGETCWNVLGIEGNGLLELHLADGSAAFALGRAGRRISAERLAELYRGSRLVTLQQRIAGLSRQYSDPLERRSISKMLRFQAGFGDSHSRAVLEEILSGKVRLSFLRQGESDLPEYRGRTHIDSSGTKEISISLQQHERLSDPSLGLTLQHEAHRDGCSLSDNEGETLEAVRSHASMAVGISRDHLYGSDFLYKDGLVLQDMAALATGETGLAALQRMYNSEGDYWRITSDGDLRWDGSHHLWGENGILLQTHAPGSFSRDVADYMGISRGEALELMGKAGFMWNESMGTYQKQASDFSLKVRPELAAQYDLLRRFSERPVAGGASDGTLDATVSSQSAYAWALREHHYRTQTIQLGEAIDPEYAAAMEELLADPVVFQQAAGLVDAADFSGISSRGELRQYSQQRLEAAVTGHPLDAAAGNGYCLAESIAAHYVDTFAEVDWADIERAFENVEWGSSFDASTGWVGDKQSFSEELSRGLGVDALAREFRFNSLDELKVFLQANAGGDAFDDYSFIADYGGHFTHVRKDGIELNSYQGWNHPAIGSETGPENWRLYGWDYSKNW
ncbi:MAG: hypothetical protein K9L66_03650 [Spirochaetaceae bacterium]|nr:hypothetical protein [Spirochaetaceae bacterium]MCF7950748.1 hypothetical protein [Spirochaetaceae bacterium]